MNSITYNDFLRYSNLLEEFHSVFYQFWNLGSPQFTDSIPTAAITFDKDGKELNFLFNPDFWASLNDNQRCFIICHECLHVILKHGIRMQYAKQSFDIESINIAMDLVINEMLVSEFGFIRDEIDPENKICWINSVFKNDKYILYEQSFEYYLNKLKGEGKDIFKTVDSHEFFFQFGDIKDLNGIFENFNLSEQESKSISEKLKRLESKDSHAGTFSNGDIRKIIGKSRKINKKWETIIKDWSIKTLKEESVYEEQWLRIDKRSSNLPQDIILPCELETYESIQPDKINLFLFLDTSGSCSHLAERLWQAAASLDKKKFNKFLYCFDTSVYPVDEKKKELYGFGGTSFHILENRIQSDIKEGKVSKYPHVFVITDGYGTNVKPEFPKKWNWILTEYHSVDNIPSNSNKFLLKDYE